MQVLPELVQFALYKHIGFKKKNQKHPNQVI